MRWHVQAWTPALWADLLAAGCLWIASGASGVPPAGLVALLPSGGGDAAAWLALIDARPFDSVAIAALATAAHAAAQARSHATLSALLPSLPALDAGLQAAGWTTGGGDHGLAVFAKDGLRGSAPGPAL